MTIDIFTIIFNMSCENYDEKSFKRSFDINYLNMWKKENNIELIGNYESTKLTRESIIKGKCITIDCNLDFCKKFRALVDMGGPYCNICCDNIKKENLKKRKNIGNTYKKWEEIKLKILYKDYLTYFDQNNNNIEEKKIISSCYVQGKCEYNNCQYFWKKKITDLFECKNFCCSFHSKIKGLEKKIKNQREALKFEESFASNPMSEYWSKENKDEDGNYIEPRYIHKKSGLEFLFICIKCNNKFKKSCAKISNGEWCGICKNKTEQKLYEFIIIHYRTIHQYKQDWCINEETNKHLPFDFCLEKLNIIIELDGRQHFIQVSNWTNPEYAQKRDKYKMKCANDNGYSVIRILQEDVWDDKYDWKKELLENINKVKEENKVQNIFMCKNNEYDKHSS